MHGMRTPFKLLRTYYCVHALIAVYFLLTTVYMRYLQCTCDLFVSYCVLLIMTGKWPYVQNMSEKWLFSPFSPNIWELMSFLHPSLFSTNFVIRDSSKTHSWLDKLLQFLLNRCHSPLSCVSGVEVWRGSSSLQRWRKSSDKTPLVPKHQYIYIYYFRVVSNFCVKFSSTFPN